MIRQNATLKWIVTLSLAVMLFSGCGGGDGYKGERGTVSGKITVGGAPAPKGTQVMFVGVSAGYMPTGTVGANGEYQLKLNGSPKLPAIKYRAQILPPTEAVSTAQKVASRVVVDPTAAMKNVTPNQKPNKATMVEMGPFPAKYSSVNTSKLEFEVKPGANSCNFDLEGMKAK